MSGNSISLFSWNVNGLRAVIRKGDLRVFLEGYRPDILLLQETKISEPQVAESGVREKFSEYAQFYSFARKAGYAGTAVWVRRELAEGASVVADIDSDGLVDKYGDLLKEGRLTGVRLGGRIYVSAYVPNSKDDLSRLGIRERWDRYLAGLLVELQKQSPVVIGGDFNVAHQPIDLARPVANMGKHGYTDEERAGFSTLLAQTEMADSFRLLHPRTVKYSWWSHWGKARERNVGWRIDYVLLSSDLTGGLLSAEIYPEVMGSDHCPVAIKMEV